MQYQTGSPPHQTTPGLYRSHAVVSRAMCNQTESGDEPLLSHRKFKGDDKEAVCAEAVEWIRKKQAEHIAAEERAGSERLHA